MAVRKCAEWSLPDFSPEEQKDVVVLTVNSVKMRMQEQTGRKGKTERKPRLERNGGALPVAMNALRESVHDW